MNNNLIAYVTIVKNYGYEISIYNFDEHIETYSAGNSPFDSQIFGATGEVVANRQLKEYALQTARNMLLEHDASEPLNIEVSYQNKIY